MNAIKFSGPRSAFSDNGFPREALHVYVDGRPPIRDGHPCCQAGPFRFAGPKCLGQMKYFAEGNHTLGDMLWFPIWLLACDFLHGRMPSSLWSVNFVLLRFVRRGKVFRSRTLKSFSRRTRVRPILKRHVNRILLWLCHCLIASVCANKISPFLYRSLRSSWSQYVLGSKVLVAAASGLWGQPRTYWNVHHLKMYFSGKGNCPYCIAFRFYFLLFGRYLGMSTCFSEHVCTHV